MKRILGFGIRGPGEEFWWGLVAKPFDKREFGAEPKKLNNFVYITTNVASNTVQFKISCIWPRGPCTKRGGGARFAP